MIGNQRFEHSGEPRGKSFGSDTLGGNAGAPLECIILLKILPWCNAMELGASAIGATSPLPRVSAKDRSPPKPAREHLAASPVVPALFRERRRHLATIFGRQSPHPFFGAGSFAGLWRPMPDGAGDAFTILTTEPGADPAFIRH
jgi:hypothetical protein